MHKLGKAFLTWLDISLGVKLFEKPLWLHFGSIFLVIIILSLSLVFSCCFLDYLLHFEGGVLKKISREKVVGGGGVGKKEKR